MKHRFKTDKDMVLLSSGEGGRWTEANEGNEGSEMSVWYLSLFPLLPSVNRPARVGDEQKPAKETKNSEMSVRCEISDSP